MATMLEKTASGTAHERLGTEVGATLRAHVTNNGRLTADKRSTLAAEADRIGGCTQRLCETNSPYQQWLRTALVPMRAGQRVGNFLCDEAQRDAVALARRHPKQIASALAGGVAALWNEKQPGRVMRLGHATTVDATRHTARQLRLIDPAHVPGTDTVAAALDTAADGLHALNEEARRIAGERVPLRFAVDRAIVELRGELDHMKARLTLAGFGDEFIDSLFPELDRKGGDAADPDDAPAPAPQP